MRRTTALVIVALATTANAQTGWDPPRRLTRTAATSETSINFARSIALDENGRVHLTWLDSRDGDPQVFYKRSPDAGVSWSPPSALSGAPGIAFNPSVASTGQFVHIVWQEQDPGAGSFPVLYRRSTDSGLAWEPETPISPTGGSPSVVAIGSTVHVVFGRPVTPDNTDIFYVRSVDAGQTWEPEVRISDMAYNSWTPTIAAAGNNVYIAWTDTFDAMVPCCQEEEYFARSTDNGATWSSPVRLTNDPPGALANSWAPSLAASGSDVWMAWFDERGGEWEIYTKRSHDFGQSWTADERLTFSDTAAQRPSIVQHASDLYIAYWDAPSGGDNEIYVLHSGDLGDTWDPSQRLTTAPGASILPSIAAGAHGVHVVWTDTRNGPSEMYYQRTPGQPVPIGNGRIAFTRMVQGLPQVFTIIPDGAGEQQLTFLGANTYPAWTKDGTMLAFTSDRTGSDQLWTMRPDATNKAQLTFNGIGNFVSDWAYDGTRIAFASVRTGVPIPEIWMMNADGSGETRLTFAPAGTFGSVHPSFSPGDQTIYYGSGASGSAQVWGMFPDGNGKEQKTHGLGPNYPEANVPEWSRTGELAFWSGFEGQYGEVWRWPFEAGGAPTKITETIDPLNSDNPAWSPDGTKILFDSNQPGGSGVSVWIMNADGSGAQQLIPDAFGQTSWQPIFGAPGCPADVDGNGAVTVNDLAYVIFRLGGAGTPGTVDGDADGNGVVDVNDIAYVIFRLGPCR